ncbi:hypothetical protein VTO42DRAFT_8886 [Malbranchea cinnamomea]
MSRASASTPWRSLYRLLLRECTYLPDPIAREYMHDYVRTSFRVFTYPPPDKPRFTVKPAQLPKKHRRARNLLSLLSRANEGYLKPLERVLLLSYGRVGKRRRELLRPLLREDNATEEQGPQHDRKRLRASHGIPPLNFESDSFQPPSALMTLLKSQAKQREIVNSKLRPVVKQFTPPVPETNIWGRPTPKKRKVNIRKRWYATLLDSALPFLPERDLGILQGLATGREEWKPPKRRAKVGSGQAEPESRPALTAAFIVQGAPKGDTFEKYSRGRPHVLTHRFMRRLWKRVCTFVPRMAWDEKKRTWTIAWGLDETPRQPCIELNRDRARDLFGGLTKDGRLPGSTQRTKAPKEEDAESDNEDTVT